MTIKFLHFSVLNVFNNFCFKLNNESLNKDLELNIWDFYLKIIYEANQVKIKKMFCK